MVALELPLHPLYTLSSPPHHAGQHHDQTAPQGCHFQKAITLHIHTPNFSHEVANEFFLVNLISLIPSFFVHGYERWSNWAAVKLLIKVILCYADLADSTLEADILIDTLISINSDISTCGYLCSLSMHLAPVIVHAYVIAISHQVFNGFRRKRRVCCEVTPAMRYLCHCCQSEKEKPSNGIVFCRQFKAFLNLTSVIHNNNLGSPRRLHLSLQKYPYLLISRVRWTTSGLKGLRYRKECPNEHLERVEWAYKLDCESKEPAAEESRIQYMHVRRSRRDRWFLGFCCRTITTAIPLTFKSSLTFTQICAFRLQWPWQMYNDENWIITVQSFSFSLPAFTSDCLDLLHTRSMWPHRHHLSIWQTLSNTLLHPLSLLPSSRLFGQGLLPKSPMVNLAKLARPVAEQPRWAEDVSQDASTDHQILYLETTCLFTASSYNLPYFHSHFANSINMFPARSLRYTQVSLPVSFRFPFS